MGMSGKEINIRHFPNVLQWSEPLTSDEDIEELKGVYIGKNGKVYKCKKLNKWKAITV